jgi:hypothetical protein
MAKVVVEGSDGTFSHGTQTVLDLDLAAEDEEFVVLAGPAGLREADGTANGGRGWRRPRRRGPRAVTTWFTDPSGASRAAVTGGGGAGVEARR